MAQKIQVLLTDDIDGSEATQTVVFSAAGKTYEIDLNDKHAAEFEAAIAPYVAAGRRTGAASARPARTRAGRGASDAGQIREWAETNGVPVSKRGRISAETRAAWAAAH